MLLFGLSGFRRKYLTANPKYDVVCRIQALSRVRIGKSINKSFSDKAIR
jgi:hypothetical protein